MREDLQLSSFRRLVWCPCPLVTTSLLFGDSETAASGMKHRAWTLTMKAAQKASPKGTSTECLGNFCPVRAKDILHWSGKACLRIASPGSQSRE